MLDFKLKGKDWFGLFFIALVFNVYPSIALQFYADHLNENPTNLLILLPFSGLVFVTILSSFILFTPIFKAFSNRLYLNNEHFSYHGKISNFLFLNIWNIFLTLITLFIYYPWYLKNLCTYIAKNMEFQSTRFDFSGKALPLLGMLLLTVFIPIILLGIGILLLKQHLQNDYIATIIIQIATYFLLIPFIYFFYKWLFNIQYKGYQIQWKTVSAEAIGIILREFFLTVISLLFYGPVAFGKLYAYFTERTFITKENKITHTFKVTLDYFEVWKITFKNIVLTILTLGIYGAWAIGELGRLYINNTKVIKIEN
jgi:uncharacterized membrane protein YjgN (DUF898 family)